MFQMKLSISLLMFPIEACDSWFSFNLSDKNSYKVKHINTYPKPLLTCLKRYPFLLLFFIILFSLFFKFFFVATEESV